MLCDALRSKHSTWFVATCLPSILLPIPARRRSPIGSVNSANLMRAGTSTRQHPPAPVSLPDWEGRHGILSAASNVKGFGGALPAAREWQGWRQRREPVCMVAYGGQ